MPGTPAPRLIFLLSLPRAGSTLLQRVLGGHPEVATSPEPWALLPMLSARVRGAGSAVYDHGTAVTAIEQFVDDEAWASATRAAGDALYVSAANGKRWFLDKTPRYALFAERLIEAYPDAAYVILWRNPLAVLASIFHTWGKDPLGIERHRVDLYDGLLGLLAAKRRLEGHGSAVEVRYEDLVSSPEQHARRVCDAIGLEFGTDMIGAVGGRRLEGAVGDPTGQREFSEVDASPVERWPERLCNPYRRAFAREYLSWLDAPRDDGESALETMGYDVLELEQKLGAAPGGWSKWGGDRARASRGRRELRARDALYEREAER
ncbi:MAG: sulfotransferase [Planctomycetota bacterium]